MIRGRGEGFQMGNERGEVIETIWRILVLWFEMQEIRMTEIRMTNPNPE